MNSEHEGHAFMFLVRPLFLLLSPDKVLSISWSGPVFPVDLEMDRMACWGCTYHLQFEHPMTSSKQSKS